MVEKIYDFESLLAPISPKLTSLSISVFNYKVAKAWTMQIGFLVNCKFPVDATRQSPEKVL